MTGPDPAGSVLPHPAEGVDPPRALDDTECRRLLGTATVGRISFTDGALPAIVPVPFALHDGLVLIPILCSSPMLGAVRGTVVAFGVDSYDPGTQTGWSVTVVGPSRVVTDPAEAAALDAVGLPSGWTGPGRCLLAVPLTLVRGWRAGRRDRNVPDHAPEASPR